MVEMMKKRKEELGYSYEQIAELSDVPLEMVKKIFEEDGGSMNYISLRAINQVLFEEAYANKICEPPSAYKAYMEKRQGEYTIEDYLAWPEEQRIELIDGVIYDMAAPVDVHQIVAFQLGRRFDDFIQKNKGRCVVVIAPIDVQLDKDDKTMVQPDIIIVCDRNQFKGGRIYGAPELVVEVLSPSTRKKDLKIKLNKYQAAGVKEYWIVDLKDKKVIVYSNMTAESKDVMIYPFDSMIPVGMYDEECVVNFGEIEEYIRFLE